MCVLSSKACCGREGLHPGFWVWMVPVHGGLWAGPGRAWPDLEREKGIRWMPWHQEAMKDVARCEKPWGAASRL
jgi:hypothetical protein